MGFFNKKKLESPMTSEVEHIISQTFEFFSKLRDKKIELLCIGDDEYGATIQIRADNLNNEHQFDEWLEKSKRKVKRISWVHIEVCGHDYEGDYRSKKFRFDGPVGQRFLTLCEKTSEGTKLNLIGN